MIWPRIKEFKGKNEPSFTAQGVIRAFPERNRLYLTRLLAEMVRQWMLLRVLVTR